MESIHEKRGENVLQGTACSSRTWPDGASWICVQTNNVSVGSSGNLVHCSKVLGKGWAVELLALLSGIDSSVQQLHEKFLRSVVLGLVIGEVIRYYQ